MRITSSANLAIPNNKRIVQATVRPRPTPITALGQIGELECVGADTGIAPSMGQSRSTAIVIPLAPGTRTIGTYRGSYRSHCESSSQHQPPQSSSWTLDQCAPGATRAIDGTF